MIKAISYWSMQDGLAGTHPIADALATAKEHGYAGLELAISNEGVLSVESSQTDCEAIRGRVDASGVVEGAWSAEFCQDGGDSLGGLGEGIVAGVVVADGSEEDGACVGDLGGDDGTCDLG